MYVHSRQMAEEVLKGGASEDEIGGASASNNDQGFEGMEALARAIELGENLTAYRMYVYEAPHHVNFLLVYKVHVQCS